MKIICVKAEDRFDNTEFNNVIVDGRAHWLRSTYTCLSCGSGINFQKKHFERLLRQNHTNLLQDSAKCFDEFAREHLADVRHYLNWTCPHCALGVRVYVKLWAGGRHGDFGIHLVDVLESLPVSSPPTKP